MRLSVHNPRGFNPVIEKELHILRNDLDPNGIHLK